jgi:hypothetical protein
MMLYEIERDDHAEGGGGGEIKNTALERYSKTGQEKIKTKE